MTRGHQARIGFVCGVAAILLTGVARAEEGVAFRNLMGSIGILPKEKDPIRYRERAPLVLPPKTELPAPSDAYASSNPQWPNDPDVAERRRRADEERRPVTWSETRRMSDNNPMLSPTELRRGRSASSEGPVPGSHRGDNARDVLLLTPDQLRAKVSSDDDVPVGGEPKRQVLTDPPSGMRRSATGGAIRPDFAPRVDQQERDANPMTWLTRKFSGGNDDE